MIEVPLNAEVHCKDGVCGVSTYVVFNPAAQEITHFVVKESAGDGMHRLVPTDMITAINAERIELACTQEALSEIEPFIEKHYVRTDVPEYEAAGFYRFPYMIRREETVLASREMPRVPKGERSIHRGATVVAKDGEVGQVDELIVDPQDMRITHLVLQEAHLFGDREVAIPMSAVEMAADDKVYLKLDKENVEALPEIPVKREYEGTVTSMELLYWAFNDADKAESVLEDLQQVSKADAFEVVNAAVLKKDAAGEVHMKETEDVDASRGALFGAVTGALIGLLGGPAGAVVGAVAGTATGGVAAHLIDMGFSDEYLKDMQDDLSPGSSMLIAMVEDQWVEDVIEALATYRDRLRRQAITDAMVKRMTEEEEERAS
jgi:uncharacterized membrane protein/sporulation protein YlmC with PRC-barrel domain